MSRFSCLCSVFLLSFITACAQAHFPCPLTAHQTGYWWTDNNNSVATKPWGMNGDIPVPGDYDGDGITDYAVWRGSGGGWFIIPSSTGQAYVIALGATGMIPVPGDYDGDGKTDLAVWIPSSGEWVIVRSSDGQTISQQWGLPGDTPIVGDFDGDGKTDYAVWRPSNQTWYVIYSRHRSKQLAAVGPSGRHGLDRRF